MKLAICIAAALALAVGVTTVEAKGSRSSGGYKASGTGSKSSSTTVRGHVTKSGAYVAPHQRTTPDKSQRNNYSANGNVNPYTGKVGKKEPKR